MANLKRKTTTKQISIRGEVQVFAHDSAMLGGGGTQNPVANRHQIGERVYPYVDIRIPGVGVLQLSVAEVKAMLDAIEDVQTRSYHPQMYNGRICSTTW